MHACMPSSGQLLKKIQFKFKSTQPFARVILSKCHVGSQNEQINIKNEVTQVNRAGTPGSQQEKVFNLGLKVFK